MAPFPAPAVDLPRLLLLHQQLPCIIWTLDRDLRYTLSHGAGLSALDLEPNQIIGMHLSEVLGNVFGERSTTSEPFACHLSALGGTPCTYIDNVKGRIFESRVQPLRDAQGSIIGVLGIAQDISDFVNSQRSLRHENVLLEARVREQTQVLREAMDRQREILESLRLALEAGKMCQWTWDMTSDRLTWDTPMELLFGFEPGTFDGCMETYLMRIHPHDRDVIRTATDSSRRGGDFDSQSDFRIQLPDGSIRFVHAQGKATTAADGKPRLMVGLAWDVTERKGREVHELHAQKLESIGQLAAGVAHEINTPIQYIGDNLRFLQDSFHELLSALTVGTPGGQAPAAPPDIAFLRTEIPNAIGQSIDGVERVGGLVGALKRFAHPGDVVPSPVDINQTVQSAVTITGNQCRNKAEVVLDLATELPRPLGTASDLIQVFVNLIMNGLDAIADAKRTQGLILIQTRLAGSHIAVAINDNGVGIPEAIRNRIFDPFFTTKEVGRGTGQGLYIAHDIVVRNHLGVLRFETAIGRGTTFIVELPLPPAA